MITDSEEFLFQSFEGQEPPVRDDSNEERNDGDVSSVRGGSSITSVEKVTAPPSGTLVYGRILKRSTLLPCKRDDKPPHLIEAMLKASKRSSSMSVNEIVAVINLRFPPKVLKEKSPVMKHNHVQLYDMLWMVTYREWNHFLKWLKKVGRTPTRHGKEIKHASPSQLNEEELKLFVTKFDYELSDEDKERAETVFLTHHNDEPYPQTPKFNTSKNKDKDGEDGRGDEDAEGGAGEETAVKESDLAPQLVDVTPQASNSMKTPLTVLNLKQKTEEKEKEGEEEEKGMHFASLHDDVDPFSLHSARIKKHYAEGMFMGSDAPPSPPDASEDNSDGGINEKKVAFQSSGAKSGGEVQGQKQKLNPHFFGHPLDLKTPHHMRKAGAGAGEGDEEDHTGECSLVSSGSSVGALDQTTNGGIKIDLFPGAGSAVKSGKKPPSKRYSIATSTPDAFRGPFVPTITKAIPIGEEDIHVDAEPYYEEGGGGGGVEDAEERSVASNSDLEVADLMKGRLELAESKVREEAAAKHRAQSQLQAVLKEKDQHLERLEDADRVRASLEGRLQETRTMLQILSAKDNDVSNLERALNTISTDHLNVPAVRGGSPYPSSPSGGSSSNSSRLNTPAELRDKEDVPIRKLVNGTSGMAFPSTREKVSSRRVNLVQAGGKSSPLLSQRALVQASEEVEGGDNTLLGMITDGDEEYRLARAHAQSHGYKMARDINKEEQASRRAEDKLKERFLGTQDPPTDHESFEAKSVKSRDLWDAQNPAELVDATPRNFRERLVKIDTRFLTVKEKLFRPFLRVHKGTGRKLFTDPAAVRGSHQTQWEICVWTIFQIYGRAGAGDSAIVRFITQFQVNRALKEAGISSDMIGKLELSLTKMRSGATKVVAAKVEATLGLGGKSKGKKMKKTGGAAPTDLRGGAGGGGGKAEFGFSFSEFLAAMAMLVTMIRDARYKVGGRGERLGAARGIASEMLSSRAIPTQRATGLLGEARDDAWEVVRSQLEERFIKICAGERGSAQAIINSKLEDTSRSLICLSGALTKGSPYLASFPREEVKAGKATDIVLSLAEIVKSPTSKDYDACSAIWDRNAETVKTLYTSYASQLEPRPYLPSNMAVGPTSVTGVGASDDLATVFASQYQDSIGASRAGAELMVSFDNLRSLLVDFQIFPQHIDFQSLARIYRSVKVWEWAWCDTLGIKYNDEEHFRLNELDPLSLSAGSGNMCLTLCGFVEVMTRVSHLGCDFSAEESDVGETLIYLLRLMNESHGRQMLLSGKRRSVNVRPFVVS